MDIITTIVQLKGTDIKTEVSNYIKKSNESQNNALKITNSDKIIEIFIEDTFICNTISSTILLMTMIDNSENIKYWNIVDEMMIEHNNNFIKNKEILKKLISINDTVKKEKNKQFINKIVKTMKKNGLCSSNLSKIQKLSKAISDCENIIEKHITKSVATNIKKNYLDVESDSILSHVSSSSSKLVININSFYYLIKRISNNELRTEIENVFMKNTNKILQIIAKLLILRKMYANALKKKTYISLIDQKSTNETENITLLISDLSNKLDEDMENVFDIVKNIVKKNNEIELNDVMYSISKYRKNIYFSPKKVIDIISHILTKYFDINLKQTELSLSDKTNIFKNTINLRIYDKKEHIGNLYMDLTNREKKVSKPTVVKLNNYWNEYENHCP